MNVVVFAHTPPPHHGQSYMVQLMLEGLGGDFSGRAENSRPGHHPIRCFHVNAQLSSDLKDIGGLRAGKLWRLFDACLAAIRLRFRHGATTLYYIPAPAKRSAVIRDWIGLGILRVFFPRIILHWHAFGLGHWAANATEYPAADPSWPVTPPRLFGRLDPVARLLTRLVYRACSRSISLTPYNQRDANFLAPKSSVVVANGIPDQCGEDFASVLGARLARLRRRELATGSDTANGPTFDLLYLSHCTREKGLFDAMDAVAHANRLSKERRLGCRIRMFIAGNFPSDEDQHEYRRRIASLPKEDDAFVRLGHVDSNRRAELLSACDALIFPTFFAPETFGLVLVEALSFGLPIIATRWRGISEIVPPDSLAALVPPQSPSALAQAILASLKFRDFAALREHFRLNFTQDRFIEKLSAAIVESP